MATLVQILSYKFAGSEWTMNNTEADDYANLIWHSATPKPTESEIRAFSAEVDGLFAADERLRRQRRAFESGEIDAILKGFEILALSQKQVINKLKPAAITEAITTTALDAMLARIAQIRNIL